MCPDFFKRNHRNDKQRQFQATELEEKYIPLPDLNFSKKKLLRFL